MGKSGHAWVSINETQEKKASGCGLTFLETLALFCCALLLGALLVPNFVRARARSPLGGCKSNLKNIGTAFEMYSTDWGGSYPDRLEQLTPNYLTTIPTCPNAERESYVATFGQQAGYNTEGYKEYYLLSCFGENHTAVSVEGNFPAYDGLRGLYERSPGPIQPSQQGSVSSRERDQALLLGCETNLLDLSQALEAYAAAHEGEYPGKWEDLFPDFLSELAECPAAGQPTYNLYTGIWTPFNEQEQPYYYYLSCFGENHKGSGLSHDLPGYSKTEKMVRRYPKKESEIGKAVRKIWSF